MTHAELVRRAVQWLRKSEKCQVVVFRPSTMTVEEPDAIGWKAGGRSTLIECKVSKQDFRRDLEKAHRRGVGMGTCRYYLTPPGLLMIEEIPDGWGLLECYPKFVRIVRPNTHRSARDWIGELRTLIAGFRRQNDEDPIDLLAGDGRKKYPPCYVI